MARAFLWITLALGLTACGADRAQLHLRPDAKGIGTLHEIFAVTNRDMREDGGFGRGRETELTLLRTEVSVPPSHEAGRTKTNARRPNPSKHFVVAEQEELATARAFKQALRQRLLTKQPEAREFTLFVHGFNTSYSEGLFRLAQMQHDIESPGVPVLFSWPSAANAVSYAHDQDSMIFSRDALGQTLFELNAVAPKKTLLVAHSMGAMLSMETMRQIEISRPGWSQRNLAGVVLIAPDIDIDVFLSQLDSIDQLPQPFIVFVSSEDKALELSGLINGSRARLGSGSDIETLQDYPIVVIDITQFADGRNADHFTVGTSPELIDFLTSPELQTVFNNRSFDTGVISASGQLVQTSAKRAEKAIQWILFPNAGRG